jgi:hypothetical protein
VNQSNALAAAFAFGQCPTSASRFGATKARYPLIDVVHDGRMEIRNLRKEIETLTGTA